MSEHLDLSSGRRITAVQVLKNTRQGACDRRHLLLGSPDAGSVGRAVMTLPCPVTPLTSRLASGQRVSHPGTGVMGSVLAKTLTDQQLVELCVEGPLQTLVAEAAAQRLTLATAGAPSHSLRVLQWVHQWCGSRLPGLVHWSAASGRLLSLVHLREHDLATRLSRGYTTDDIKAACAIDAVEDQACEAAAEKGHLKCLVYLHLSGAYWSDVALQAAARHEHVACVAYFLVHDGDFWDVEECAAWLKDEHRRDCVSSTACRYKACRDMMRSRTRWERLGARFEHERLALVRGRPSELALSRFLQLRSPTASGSSSPLE